VVAVQRGTAVAGVAAVVAVGALVGVGVYELADDGAGRHAASTSPPSSPAPSPPAHTATGTPAVVTPTAPTPRPTPRAKPSVVVVRDRRPQTRPSPYTADLELPVLRGVPSGTSGGFRALVEAAIADRVDELGSAPQVTCGSDAAAEPQLTSDVRVAGVYAGRYASALVDVWVYPGCAAHAEDDPFGVTLDLRTGEPVSLARFAETGGELGALDWTLISWLHSADRVCFPDGALLPGYDEEIADGETTNVVPRPDAWAVSAKGLTAAFGVHAGMTGACNGARVTVPWAWVIPPVPASARTSSVLLLSPVAGDPRSGLVSQRGAQVALSLEDHGEDCWVGVRKGDVVSAYDLFTGARRTWHVVGPASRPVLDDHEGLVPATDPQTSVFFDTYGGPQEAFGECADVIGPNAQDL